MSSLAIPCLVDTRSKKKTLTGFFFQLRAFLLLSFVLHSALVADDSKVLRIHIDIYIVDSPYHV